MRTPAAVLAAVLAASGGRADPPRDPVPAALTDYVSAPDAAFAWKQVAKVETDGATLYTLKMTSQQWHGTTWDHDIQVVVPTGGPRPATALLWNQGGPASAAAGLLAVQIATRAKVPVVFVYGVPNQPLFGGKTEDALIAETFVKYLDTGDPTWPLLFPMVKAVVRAMDAVQAFAKTELHHAVTGFVVTGASKRGWTAWLTAATGDKRVTAIAPLVIDTLNFPAQMRNQVEAFGTPSKMIADYTARGLVPIPDTPAARKLWQMVDPYAYRAKLTLPKLLIHGGNDPYWPVDAVDSYWPALTGDKYLLVVPNAGHDLREADEKGKKQTLPDRAVATLAAFTKAQIDGTPLPPCPDPEFVPTAAGGVRVKFRVDPAALTPGYSLGGPVPGRATLWTADSPTRDFRAARWAGSDQGLLEGGGAREIITKVVVTVPPADKRFRAAFVERPFTANGLKYTLSSPVRVLPPAPSP